MILLRIFGETEKPYPCRGHDRLYFMADSLASLGVERYRRCRRIRNRIYRESLSRVVLGSGGPTILKGIDPSSGSRSDWSLENNSGSGG
jgi:hypothetical protein